jgi:lysophospholipase-3
MMDRAVLAALVIISALFVKPHSSILISPNFLRYDADNAAHTLENDFQYRPDPAPKDLNFTLYPVILIPGDGGNQLYAKLNKTSAPHYLCKLKSADYMLLWLSLQEVPPYVLDCFVDNMSLDYNNATRTTSDRPGVDIKVKGFGDTDTVEYLDSSRYSVTGYFNVIVDALVKRYNHKRGVTIRGAPYDWRRAPNEFDDYYANFTRLVEETYETNNKTKVMLIAHSMGK